MRHPVLITALALVLALSAASTAAATFPGENGPILYRTVDFDTGLGVPLFRAQPDGSGTSVISDRPGFFSDWRADGRLIAFDFFDAEGNEQIATVRPDGSDFRAITSGRGIHEVPSWSPNGRRIVFGFSPEPDPNTPGFETRLWTMRPDGSKARPLPLNRPGFDSTPRYSPDGRWIVFARLHTLSDGYESALFIVQAQGGRVRQLTPWGEIDENPTWSPDSRRVIFAVGPEGSIEAIRPDGSHRHTIVAAREGFGGHKPWYSPDGTRILLVCENWGTLPEPPPDFNEDICVMDADGTDIVNLTGTPETFENWPSWGPTPPR